MISLMVQEFSLRNKQSATNALILLKKYHHPRYAMLRRCMVTMKCNCYLKQD